MPFWAGGFLFNMVPRASWSGITRNPLPHQRSGDQDSNIFVTL